jgi:hypothetical protein
MKSIAQKNKMIKRARAGVKGLIIRWNDADPLRDTPSPLPGQVSHRNPIMNLTAEKVYQDCSDWIRNIQPFKWLITITVVFCYDNGQRQNEVRELTAFATISQINEHCLDAIRDALRYGDTKKYTHTEFIIERIDVADRSRAA